MRVLKVSVYLQAMKNIFYTIICCLISLTSLAQSDFGYENPDGRDPREEGMQRDSTKEQRYVPHHRLTWKWVHDGVYKEFYQIDTKHKLDIQTQCFQYIPGKLPGPLCIRYLHSASPRRRFLTARSAKRLFL